MKKRGRSGQVLIITSLIVVMLLLAAVIYISDVQKKAPRYEAESNAVFSAVQVGAIHTAISSLANITNGGLTNVFSQNFDEFKSAVMGQSSDGIIYLNYALSSASPYADGIWLLWGTNGKGVSSAAATIFLNYSSSKAVRFSEFDVNITSEIDVVGSYLFVNGSTKQASIEFTLFNAEKPAVASDFSVFYKTSDLSSPGEWIAPASTATQNFGNGTQSVSFSVTNQTQSDPLLISVYGRDSRGISVMANATCSQA